MNNAVFYILLCVAGVLLVQYNAAPLQGPWNECEYERSGYMINFETNQRSDHVIVFRYLRAPGEECCPEGTEVVTDVGPVIPAPWAESEEVMLTSKGWWEHQDVQCSLTGKFVLLWNKWWARKYGGWIIPVTKAEADHRDAMIERWKKSNSVAGNIAL